jgi:hypothetical protein
MSGTAEVTIHHFIADRALALFDVALLREFRFEDSGGVEGPLGWSALMTRR